MQIRAKEMVHIYKWTCRISEAVKLGATILSLLCLEDHSRLNYKEGSSRFCFPSTLVECTLYRVLVFVF